jgi:hypothetical protein
MLHLLAQVVSSVLRSLLYAIFDGCAQRASSVYGQTSSPDTSSRERFSATQEEHELASSGKERCFATKGWPFCLERVAASTNKTGRKGKFSWETKIDFLGSTMVPKSMMWQSFLTIPLYKTEPFTLNCGQTFLTIGAKVYDELQLVRYIAWA